MSCQWIFQQQICSTAYGVWNPAPVGPRCFLCFRDTSRYLGVGAGGAKCGLRVCVIPAKEKNILCKYI